MEREPVDIELPEEEEKEGFPWLVVLIVVVVVGLAAVWINFSKPDPGSVAALEQELKQERAVLEEERQKVFTLTAELEALKQKIDYGKTPDRTEAVQEYNRMVAAQKAQRVKVKALADQYNQKVSRLHELK